MANERTFKEIWKDWCRNGENWREYYEASVKHIGWRYSYKGWNVVYTKSDKESSFMKAMEEFQKIFGVFGVVEDDVRFNPLFNE
jgi:hypothetical protein